jgi:replication initiation and membrane attachment protein DnaB
MTKKKDLAMEIINVIITFLFFLKEMKMAILS